MSAKILVVDDEHFVRDLLVKILARQGHDVRGVADAAEALRQLESESWDLVLTDVVMPGIDGFELLRRVKGSWPAVKVIVLTGYARRQSISDFLLYGADEYLAKPFQVHELLAVVSRVTGVPATA
ncbi:MAG: response regulator [Planctomycetes bacterium]|nr:response regulator [Planctomycetota bacterium]